MSNPNFTISLSAEKINVLSLRVGEWFVPVNYGEEFFRPFKLTGKQSFHVTGEDMSGVTKLFQHMDKAVRVSIGAGEDFKVRVEDVIVEDFGSKWGFSKSGDCHAYLSPMEIIFQRSDDGTFVEFDGDRVTESATDKFDEYLASLPRWKGDLADMVSFFFALGQVYDFTDKVEGGLVWLNESLSPIAEEHEFPKTARERYQMTFKEFFEDYLTTPDIELFVLRRVVPEGLHLK